MGFGGGRGCSLGFGVFLIECCFTSSACKTFQTLKNLQHTSTVVLSNPQFVFG